MDEAGWTLERVLAGDVEAIRARAAQDPRFLERRDAEGRTPLSTAVECDRPDLVRVLLGLGANPDPDVEDGYTPLLLAVESDAGVSDETVELLLAAGARLEREGWNGWTALHMAAARGRNQKLNRLLQAGAGIDHQSSDGGSTPLMEAAREGNVEAVRTLLARGADDRLRDWVGGLDALEHARQAAQGPSAELVARLDVLVTPAEVEAVRDHAMGDASVSPEDRVRIESGLAGANLAALYSSAARARALRGDHAEVVRLLEAHRATR